MACLGGSSAHRPGWLRVVAQLTPPLCYSLQHGLPDAAVALVAACRDAGLPLQPPQPAAAAGQQAGGAAGGGAGPSAAAASGAGELQNLFVGSGQAARGVQRFNSGGCAWWHPLREGAAGAGAGVAGLCCGIPSLHPPAQTSLPRAASERLPERGAAGGGGGSDGAGAALLQRTATLTDYERSETARDFQLYVCEVLQQL